MSRPLAPPRNAPPADVVLTPAYLAEEVIRHFAPQGRILDPARGEGAFFDRFPGGCERDWCEIADGRDFLTYPFEGRFDWVVTNPPWSKMRVFLHRAMDLADDIVYLTLVNHFTTQARFREIGERGFGIREWYGVKTPAKPWPWSGFQLAAVHVQRGYLGPIHLTGNLSPSALAA